jgi:hypothetical protein
MVVGPDTATCDACPVEVPIALDPVLAAAA